jgi:hypothetical protein
MVRRKIKMKTIKYNQVDRILGDHLIQVGDRIYRTKEDIKRFPKTITLVDNGLSEDDFADIMQDMRTALNGSD